MLYLLNVNEFCDLDLLEFNTSYSIQTSSKDMGCTDAINFHCSDSNIIKNNLHTFCCSLQTITQAATRLANDNRKKKKEKGKRDWKLENYCLEDGNLLSSSLRLLNFEIDRRRFLNTARILYENLSSLEFS